MPPIPFDIRHCELALKMKEAGLPWCPHAGCFVWDREGCIEVPSPFPGKIFFILNLGHFLRLLGSIEKITQKLIWLPAWHQARHIGVKLGIEDREFMDLFAGPKVPEPGEALLALYGLIQNKLPK